MWFPNTEMLGNNPTAFLCLSWYEMFEPTTPDTYQPRLSNTQSLLAEIGEVAIKTVENNRWIKHLEMLQSELAEVTKEENDLLAELPYYGWIVSQFCSEKPKTLVHLAETIKHHEVSYRDTIEKHLLLAAAALPKEKEKSIRWLRRWATIALQSGCTATEMKALASDTSITLSPADFAKSLVSAVKAPNESFRCIIAVTGKRGDIRALVAEQSFEFLKSNAVKENEHLRVFQSATSKLCEHDDAPHLLATTLGASNPRQAISTAVRELRDAFDIYNFYSEKTVVSILPISIAIDSAHNTHEINLSEHELRRRGPRKRARAITVNVVKRVKRNLLDGRILNALEHYSLAHGSTAARVRLVNLWTALECLSGAADSVISNTAEMVAPITVWRRSDKIVTYVSRCIQTLRETSPSVDIAPSFLKSHGGDVYREEVLIALCSPAHSEPIKSLLRFCSQNPLLCNKVFHLWKSFSDPANLKVELLRSKKRIEWHLYRIYRARNMIVHEGKDAKMLQALLDNLHYYFSITLSRVLHGMQSKQGISVDASIAYWKSRAHYVTDSLDSKPESLKICDFIAMPIEKYAGRQLWG